MTSEVAQGLGFAVQIHAGPMFALYKAYHESVSSLGGEDHTTHANGGVRQSLTDLLAQLQYSRRRLGRLVPSADVKLMV